MKSLHRLLPLVLLLTTFSGMPKPGFVKFKVHAEAGVIPVKEEDSEKIPWIIDRRLDWEDFLCEPKRGTDAVASTSTTLGITYQVKNNKLTYEITCNFSKVKSWGLLKTPYILAHEQAHFDITELYARKLNQELSQYEFNKRTFKQDINNIYQKIVDEKEAFQKTYDGETDHSRNKRAQFEWLDKIDELLLETEPFANYP